MARGGAGLAQHGGGEAIDLMWPKPVHSTPTAGGTRWSGWVDLISMETGLRLPLAGQGTVSQADTMGPWAGGEWHAGARKEGRAGTRIMGW